MVKELPYWKDGILHGSVSSKAKKFNRLKLVRNTGDGIFEILPIPGYNKTIYTYDSNTKQCNCQGFSKNDRCTHQEAVMLFLEVLK